MSVNAWNLYGSDTDDEEERYAALEALVRARNPDVVAIQEIISDGDSRNAKWPGAASGLRRFAGAIGRNCEVAGDPAVAVGGVIHHTGLAWRDGIEPIPGTLHRLEREGAGMWHCAVSIVLDLGGTRIRFGSVQLSPFDQTWAKMDVNQLLRVFNRDQIPGFLGGDFNGIGMHDPDPYEGVPWHPDHAYQLDEHGRVDRQAGTRLEHPKLGAMPDCARMAGAGYIPTTGHHDLDNHPERGVDRWHATRLVPKSAVVGHRVATLGEVRLDDKRWLTDHRPREIEVNHREVA